MTRSISSIFMAVVLTASVFATGAHADSIVEFVAEVLDGASSGFTQSFPGGNQDVFVDLSKVNPSFFANHYTVLDARISYDLGVLLDPDCPPYVQILTSDATRSAGMRIRRSAENRVSTQRVAVAQPLGRYYMVQIRRNSPNVSTAGPCPTVQSIPFTLTVKLFASPASSVGFGFNPMHLSSAGDGEPTIAVDRWSGTPAVYVSAPVGGPAILGGNPAGVDFWRSLDGGNTFAYSQPSFSLNAIGGFDSHLSIARNGTVYQADLGAAAVYVGFSTDHGATWTGTTPPGVDSDREWLANYTPPGASGPTKVFVSYHDINVDNLPYECLIVTEAGTAVGQPVCNPMVTDPVVLANAFGNTFIGNQVFGSDGVVYSVFASPGAPSGGAPAATRNVYVAKSADGIVFTDRLVYSAPVGNDVAALFPVIAIDAADNLYAVWSERQAPFGPSAIKLSSSSDHGNTWSVPQVVSTNTRSAVLPWITAGSPGSIDVAWVGSSNPSSNDPTADWFVYVAQSKSNGGFNVARVSPQPIRYGSICLQGLGCSTAGDNGRILLDFITIDHDALGNAHLSYANSGPEGPDGDPGRTYIDYARQGTGPTIGN